MLVGYTYAFGWGGVEKDDAKAIYWFRRSGPIGSTRATAGDDTDPAASYELDVAQAYANGTQGVTVDSVASAKWLLRAANGGNREAVLLTRARH